MHMLPNISIVMPAYNAERYIRKAIESILEQTFTGFELIIVNDGSTDGTGKVVRQFNDRRIVYHERTAKSGSAYIPRAEAVTLAQSEWIVSIDADDFIEKNMLEKLFIKAQKYGTDICCPWMHVTDESGEKILKVLPTSEFVFGKIFSGREAFNFTVPEWRVGLNGALIKKELWEKALKFYSISEKREIHDDENISKIMLLEAKGFSVEKTKYFLRSNSGSVTKKFSLNTFGWMKSNDDLLNITERYLSKESQEYEAVKIYNYHCYRSVYVDFVKSASDINGFSEGINLLRVWYKKIDWPLVIEKENNLKTRILSDFWISFVVLLFKYPNRVYMRCFFKKILTKISSGVLGNKYYAWYVTRKKRSQNMQEFLKANYYVSKEKKEYSPYVMNIFDGGISDGGITDRLKGIIGTYYIAKRKKLQYKLLFKKPFPLEDFFIPNFYDWSVDDETVCKNWQNINLIVLDNTQDSIYQIHKQREYLEEKIVCNNKQTHVYSNTSFAYDLNYSELFTELFKPSARLQAAIDYHKGKIGTGYISVSCRFLELLGDFCEPWDHVDVLQAEERKLLLNRIDHTIEALREDNPGKKILLNSDSKTFLNGYRNREYVYIVPGEIKHSAEPQAVYRYEMYEKTFLDFWLIANAEKIFLIKSEKMHKSGYPYAASKIYSRPFEIVEI